MSTTNLVTDPDAFFERKSKNPSLITSTAIVLLAALLSTAAIYPVIQYAQRGFEGSAAEAGGIFTALILATTFFTPIGLWLLFTVIFHIAMRIAFDGQGTFKHTLALVGWGFVPIIISSLISGIAAFVVIGSGTPGAISNAQEMTAVIENVQMIPALQMASIIGVALTIWQGFIWVIALKHGHEVSVRNTAITVGIPLGLWAIYQLSVIF